MHKHKLDMSWLRFRSGVRRLRWTVLLVVASAFSSGQDLQPSPVLTLDDAIRLAIANNRSLKVASLEVDKSKWQVAEVKTKRLPSFSGSVLGSQLLNEVSFNFPAGAFGTIPGVGPFPTTDTKVTTPRQPVAYVVSQTTQPLS
jgi:outer membrane protein TolC